MVRGGASALPQSSKRIEMDYKTTDLYLASYLKAIRTPFKGTKRDGGKIAFVFDQVSQETINGFFQDVQVGVNSYKNAIQDLKDMIYITKRGTYE
jgi:hypothetical protein